MKIIKTSKKTENDLLEELSDLEHDQWAHWTEYMLDNNDEENHKRWRRQIATDYKDLSEDEKDGDREWAEKVIKIFKKYKNEL